MLRTDELIFHILSCLRRSIKGLLQAGRNTWLSPSTDRRQFRILACNQPCKLCNINAHLFEQWPCNPIGLVQHGREQMQRNDFRIASARSTPLSLCDQSLCFVGQFIESECHGSHPPLAITFSPGLIHGFMSKHEKRRVFDTRLLLNQQSSTITL